MSFSGSYVTKSFVSELWSGIHAFGTDTFKMALYTSSATLNESTTAYSATNEASGTGYSAGGAALSGFVLTQFSTMNGTITSVTFSNPSWPGASFTARGALIYNSSKANRAFMVLDFGADKTASGTTFTVQFPPNTANTALVTVQVMPNPLPPR